MEQNLSNHHSLAKAKLQQSSSNTKHSDSDSDSDINNSPLSPASDGNDEPKKKKTRKRPEPKFTFDRSIGRYTHIPSEWLKPFRNDFPLLDIDFEIKNSEAYCRDHADYSDYQAQLRNWLRNAERRRKEQSVFFTKRNDEPLLR